MFFLPDSYIISGHSGDASRSDGSGVGDGGRCSHDGFSGGEGCLISRLSLAAPHKISEKAALTSSHAAHQRSFVEIPEDRITIRVLGSPAALGELKSLTASFPGSIEADGPISERYNSVGGKAEDWLSLAGSVVSIVGFVKMYLAKRQTPRNLIVHKRNGEAIILLQNPSKEEVAEAFKNASQLTDISLVDPQPEAKEPGVIEGFAAKPKPSGGDGQT